MSDLDSDTKYSVGNINTNDDELWKNNIHHNVRQQLRGMKKV